MPKIYLLSDHPWPIIWREPQPPKTPMGQRPWHFVAEVEEDEIPRTVELLFQDSRSPEPRPS